MFLRILFSFVCFTAAMAILSGSLSSAATAPDDAKEKQNSLLIINKTKNELAYFADGVLVRTFPVATGAEPEYTPEGTFPIVNKIKNRPYYKENIPGGDPSNPLGDRWLGLHVNGTYGTTYAIHGNSNRNVIGSYVSAGCVRMYNDDIHWLFDRIVLNTSVVIVSSELTFEELAVQHHYELEQPFEGELFVNGTPYDLGREAVVYRGKTLLPLRACIELMGGSVDWDAAAGLVASHVGEYFLLHRPASSIVFVNGEAVAIESKTKVRNGTVMIQLRDLARITGWDVQWEEETKRIYMSKDLQEDYASPPAASQFDISSRTLGATSVPSSSMAFITSS